MTFNMQGMNSIKQIRRMLNMSQPEFGRAIGLTQGTVSNYEVGKTFVSPCVARVIIELAAKHGHKVSFDDVYAEFAPRPHNFDRRIRQKMALANEG